MALSVRKGSGAGSAGSDDPLPDAARAPGGNAAAWAVIAVSSTVIVWDVAAQFAGR